MRFRVSQNSRQHSNLPKKGKSYNSSSYRGQVREGLKIMEHSIFRPPCSWRWRIDLKRHETNSVWYGSWNSCQMVFLESYKGEAPNVKKCGVKKEEIESWPPSISNENSIFVPFEPYHKRNTTTKEDVTWMLYEWLPNSCLVWYSRVLVSWW